MSANPVADTRLPLVLLTGFLGAGKTTLLLRWLSESPSTGLRLGVVMNEFGLESVDSQLIDRPGLPVRQVSGGCVCCASDDELDRAVAQLVASGNCDYVVVETSGLADPDNVIDVLTDDELLATCRLQAVVTVVDGPWYARPEAGGDIGERVLARRQIEFAHVVCLSKCDRIRPEEVDVAEAAIRQVNPRAEIVRLPFGLPDIGELLRRPPAESRLDLLSTDPSSRAAHLHASYQSVTWRFPGPVDRGAFEKFLSRLDPKEVVRAKGFVRFTRSPDRLHVFQTVWGHHLIEELPSGTRPESVAVLIGPSLDPERHRSALRTLVFGEGAGALKLGVA
jgi:G3E family GTPase